MTKINITKNLPALAFLFIATFFSSFPWSLYGMNWGDSSMIFHFGNRLIHGTFPYVDYPYQIGYLPIIFDGLAQQILGEYYWASLLVTFIVKLATILVFYYIFKQFTSQILSVVICTGLAFLNPILNNIGGSNYVNLFLASTILFFILGMKTNKKKVSWLYIALAGFCLALVVGARQSNAILCLLLTLGIVLVYSLQNFKQYWLTLIIPFSTGLFVGIVNLGGFLVLNKALSPALKQLFIDAGEKKNIKALYSILDGLSGGIYGSNIWNVRRFMIYPLIISILILILIIILNNSSNKKLVFLNQLTISLIPILLIFGLAEEQFSIIGNFRGIPIIWPIIKEIKPLMLTYDLPRIFFSFVLLISCIFPKRFQKLLGLPYLAFPLLIALTLGTTWAMQISWPGRRNTDLTMLIPLVLFSVIMSTKVTVNWKKLISFGFLVVTSSIFFSQLASESLVVGGNNDGLYKDAQYQLDHPMAQVIKVSQEKAIAFSMLKQNIKPGDSCFIYGSAPVLYTLLECKNPTLLDSTYVDFYTLNNAHKAIADLESDPPDWIIETIGSISISKDYDGSPNFYGSFNQESPKKIHTYLQKIIDNYQLVNVVRELFPETQEFKNQDYDRIIDLRLYKRMYEKS